jgi:uncharacterized spore protein YtfJ
MKVHRETVHGEPMVVEGQRIEPVARRTVGVWRKATIGQEISGQGGAVVRLQPVGVRVGQGPEARFVPVHDRTRQILWIMLAAAVVVPLLLIIATRMARE